MIKRIILSLSISFALLVLAFGLIAARGMEGAFNQTGMDMGTATPPAEDTMVMPTAGSTTVDPMDMPASQPHIVPLPDEYESYTNPVPADSDSISRGADLYNANCASCHGVSGLGDGAGGAALNPPPSALAWTSQMLTDTFMFYRISEGGGVEPFNSAMPAWKNLTEDDRWDLVNYIRSLSSSTGALASQVTGCGMTSSGTMDGTSNMSSGCITSSGTYTGTTGMTTGSMSGMSCPMMGGSTTGMGMGGMTMGMGGMDMSGMSGMPGMSGMDMSGMPGMTNMDMSGMNTVAEVYTPWYTNPWALLGWILVALVTVGIIGGLVTGVVILVTRSKGGKAV